MRKLKRVIVPVVMSIAMMAFGVMAGAEDVETSAAVVEESTAAEDATAETEPPIAGLAMAGAANPGSENTEDDDNLNDMNTIEAEPEEAEVVTTVLLAGAAPDEEDGLAQPDIDGAEPADGAGFYGPAAGADEEEDMAVAMMGEEAEEAVQENGKAMDMARTLSVGNEAQKSYTVYYICGAAVLLAAVVVVILVLKKKKK